MKILYDYQILRGQRFGGISRYYYELIHQLKGKEDVRTVLPCWFSKNFYFKDQYGMKDPSWIPEYMKTALNQYWTRFRLKCGKYDIVHPTYYEPYLIGKVKGKIVITVYDLIHEKFKEMFAGTDDILDKKRASILGADHIIAISESTRKDILEYYPEVDEKKITVIYIASCFTPAAGAAAGEAFPEKYILFVGNRNLYKNYARFYEAVDPILREDHSLHLVCIGGGPFSDEEKKNQASNADRIRQLDASDEILSYAYTHAQCFVFPSLYEGFGIPTLEAFACNCPTVLSNTSSMPEVGGDAVVYIDPYDTADMRDKIQKVLDSESLREELRIRGKEQLAKFSWEEIANQTLACYQKVLKG